jgi:hypothetical protein
VGFKSDRKSLFSSRHKNDIRLAEAFTGTSIPARVS